jgi:hypothetical protein
VGSTSTEEMAVLTVTPSRFASRPQMSGASAGLRRRERGPDSPTEDARDLVAYLNVLGRSAMQSSSSPTSAETPLDFLQSSEGERIFRHWGWEAKK